MHLPGVPSLAYLFYLLAFMPWMAVRSMRKLAPVLSPRASAHGPSAGEPTLPSTPSREQLFASTLVSLALLLYLTWITGGTFGFRIFAAPALGTREILAGATTFAVAIGLMLLNRAVRTADERRTMAVYKLMPRAPREWALYVTTALAAGVAEEAAYRGVLMAILACSFGSAWVAVAISAGAFAASHALQGWKSGITIFMMALAMHALVWFTGTVVVAMVVHAVYDLAAGVLGAWRVRTNQVDG
ncbi:MAG: CPBP family intramembrane glutamic endopeptidase [Gemmatimonadales bacterium]